MVVSTQVPLQSTMVGKPDTDKATSVYTHKSTMAGKYVADCSFMATMVKVMAQGCSLSPILFSVFINDLLIEVEKAGLGVQFNNGKSIGGLLFADDFVGMSDSRENLQKLIDVVHKFCNRWRLKANVSKCAVVVFSKSKVPGSWTWGEHTIPQASSYCYLGIDFTSDGGWDTHVKRVISNGRKIVNKLHSIISNRNINLSARRLLLLSVLRPSIEYGSEVWKCNKSQASALESILLGGSKKDSWMLI